MSSKFRHVALIGKYQAQGSRSALEDIARFLGEQGCDIALEKETAKNTGITAHTILDVLQIGQQCDLCLVVGGDGTMLGIGRQLAQFGVPLVGINQGRLGFITDIAFDDYQTTLTPMLHGNYQEDSRWMMQAEVVRGGESVFNATAMNDVVVNRGASAGMVELRVEIDGRFVANQRADGLIIASPTGATAYALSAGGPLMHPSIGGWILAPIAPHTLSNRPIVLSDKGEIAIEIVAGRDPSVNFDMQTFASLRHGDRIIVRRSAHQVRFLHPVGWSYFDTLRKKLHWNAGVA
jgi:NAD+ kinase